MAPHDGAYAEALGAVQRDTLLGTLLASLGGGAPNAPQRTGLEARAPLLPSLAGSALERIVVRHTMPSGASWRTRHVVKWLQPRHGWLGAATHDTHLREVQLARSGLLDTLPSALATPVRAVRVRVDSTTPAAGALLMDDVSPYLLRHEIGGPAGRLTTELLTLLDRLARLHARYWCDPRLRDPALGLVSPRDALLLAAPQTLAERIAAGDRNPYLPRALRGWEAFLAQAAPADASTLKAVWRDPEPVLHAIAALRWTLVHGDVWAPNLGWLPPAGVHRTPLRPAYSLRLSPDAARYPLSPWERGPGGEVRLLLLDWALSAAAPATYDPLWLCGTTHTLDPVSVLAAYRPRLEHHLRARDITLAPAVWRDLAHAGYLRTALTCGEALGRTAAQAASGAARRSAEARVRWWARRAARGAHALTRD